LKRRRRLKKRHIAAKLCLARPGLSVLDIGSGWGGMALTLARDYGATVTGITLSTEQLAEAQARAKAEGLADRVSFQLLDYRAMDQRFDRIVSVDMFEHVGVFHYRAFFDMVSRCLKPDGVALLHSYEMDEATGEESERDIPSLKGYTVFNVEQVGGFPTFTRWRSLCSMRFSALRARRVFCKHARRYKARRQQGLLSHLHRPCADAAV
jgi:cyclopropane fatty-acyl-phospholipid synthase-like methyltransferase